MHPMLNTAVKAARKAGNIISRASQNLDILTVTEKSAHDFVSEVDGQAEQAIIDILLDAYPKHSILAEESGASGESEYQWIIDPLDGTTNFLHGFPQYAVSIGLAHKGVLTQAVVYDPTSNDLFTASRGDGAYLNNKRIRVSNRIKFDHALLGTGFPFRDFSHVDFYLNIFREVMQKTAGVRRAGSAALDLAYVASGRLDGFWEFGLKPWDMAAGVLLITEAGGFVADTNGKDAFMESGNIVCGNPKIFQQLLQILDAHQKAGVIKK